MNTNPEKDLVKALEDVWQVLDEDRYVNRYLPAEDIFVQYLQLRCAAEQLAVRAEAYLFGQKKDNAPLTKPKKDSKRTVAEVVARCFDPQKGMKGQNGKEKSRKSKDK